MENDTNFVQFPKESHDRELAEEARRLWPYLLPMIKNLFRKPKELTLEDLQPLYRIFDDSPFGAGKPVEKPVETIQKIKDSIKDNRIEKEKQAFRAGFLSAALRFLIDKEEALNPDLYHKSVSEALDNYFKEP